MKASRRFQPGEGPSRGLLRDYEPSDGPSFPSLCTADLVAGDDSVLLLGLVPLDHHRARGQRPHLHVAGRGPGPWNYSTIIIILCIILLIIRVNAGVGEVLTFVSGHPAARLWQQK